MIIFIQFLDLLVIVSMTILISSFTYTPFATIIITFVLIALPKGLEDIFQNGNFLNKLVHYFPINNYTSNNILNDMPFENVYFYNNFIFNLVVIIASVIVISTIMLYVVYKHQKNYYIS